MSIPASFPEHLCRLSKLWNEKRGDRAMPARRDFHTIELEPWLSDLHLVAVRPEGLRFIVFAAGPAARYGTEMTGRYVAELEPAAFARDVERTYLSAVETRSPVFSAQAAPSRGSLSRLILPLSDDGITVDRLLVAVRDSSVSVGPRSGATQALLTSMWTLAETFEFARPFPPARVASMLPAGAVP